jgi:hypothetical protein
MSPTKYTKKVKTRSKPARLFEEYNDIVETQKTVVASNITKKQKRNKFENNNDKKK